MIQARFDRTIDGILSLRNWIVENKCPVVGCESTNSFWYPIYDTLSPVCEVIVGNAHDMKVLSHKKTDKIDSEIIAKLILNDMVLPSYIATPVQRDLRNLMRYRKFLVFQTVDIKNRIHSILQAELFHLSSILTDPFGLSGKLVIQGIISGKSAESIMALIPDKVLKAKGDLIQELLNQQISATAIIELDSAMSLLETLNKQIKEITTLARNSVLSLYPREFEILCSIPGVGEITAMTLISEIGEFKNFVSGDKLAAWAGLVPKVHQSANHYVRCGITHRGSKYLRSSLVEAAHAATRKKGSRFKEYYDTRKDRLGKGKTIVAVARKILTIAWHLIVNDELFVNEGEKTKKQVNLKSVEIPLTLTLKQVVERFVRAKEMLVDKDRRGFCL